MNEVPRRKISSCLEDHCTNKWKDWSKKIRANQLIGLVYATFLTLMRELNNGKNLLCLVFYWVIEWWPMVGPYGQADGQWKTTIKGFFTVWSLTLQKSLWELKEHIKGVIFGKWFIGKTVKTILMAMGTENSRALRQVNTCIRGNQLSCGWYIVRENSWLWEKTVFAILYCIHAL
jgi:hypothetical protein